MSATATDPIWIGLDLGTQSVRALAVSGTGGIVGGAARPLQSHRDGARHEQDPERWWSALTSACREALADVAVDRIRGVAADSTSGTILLLDPNGRAVTPGIMYDDLRAADLADRVNDTGAAVWNSLGYRMQPAWALPKVLWLVEHEPALVRHGRLAHQADFITHRLTGHAVPSDTSHALKTGYDLIRQRWPRDVLSELGIPDRLLPAVVQPGAILGEVSRAAHDETGIPAGTPVIAGMTDGCAAQLASGALREGDWNSVLGTTLVLKGVTRELIRDPAGMVYSHRAPDGGWLPGGASSAGAGALSARFPGRDLDELGRRAAEREPSTALAYPLVARGERFPFCAPDAQGFVVGEPADENDLFAAILQGVAFLERLCFDYVDLLGAPTGGELRLTGGAIRSRYWCQLRADVLRRVVELPTQSEPALGMAVLAAADGDSLTATAARMVSVRERIEPRERHRGCFEDAYRRFVGELERRGWLEGRVADYARARSQA